MIDAIALAKAAKDEDALNQEQEKKKPFIFKVSSKIISLKIKFFNK